MNNLEEQLSTLLDLIAEAPLSSGGWEPVLVGLADLVGARAADLTFFGMNPVRIIRTETGRIDTQAYNQYLEDYAHSFPAVHPRAVMLEHGAEGQILTDSDFYSAAEMDKNPFYSELLPLLDFRHAMVSFPKKDFSGKGFYCFAVQYSRRDEVPSADQRQRFSLLLPHLRRACAVDEKLRKAEVENAALTDILDRMSESVALLDPAGRVVRANHPARQLFEQGNGLSLGYRNRLILPNSETRSALERALQACTAAFSVVLRNQSVAAPIMVPRPVGGALALTLQALPASAREAYGAVALLFIGRRRGTAETPLDSLRKIYGLTPSEASLMQGLANGERLKEFAARNQISYETARSRLRDVFRKTGARRQAELIQLYTQGPAA